MMIERECGREERGNERKGDEKNREKKGIWEVLEEREDRSMKWEIGGIG